MEFKGTKGKWIADIQHHKVYKPDGNILCVLYHTNNVNKEESPINAQLISKAPEMLEILKSILGSEHLKGTIEESKIIQLIKEATTI